MFGAMRPENILYCRGRRTPSPRDDSKVLPDALIVSRYCDEKIFVQKIKVAVAEYCAGSRVGAAGSQICTAKCERAD
jgi:hypothetical protein